MSAQGNQQPREQLTRLLSDARAGDRVAEEEAARILYEELRSLARTHRARWSGDYTLQATALVNEAWIRLFGSAGDPFRDRGHFLAVASRAMRQVLVSYARMRSAQKRGGRGEDVSLDDFNPVAPEVADEIVALHDALEDLQVTNERATRVVELRFFLGLSIAEAAEALGISEPTVKRDWALARAVLKDSIDRSMR